MHSGKVEEASALAARIGREIVRSSEKRLCKVDGRVDPKGMWAAVNRNHWPKTGSK